MKHNQVFKMSMTEGCLNVQFLIQKYICPPIQLDKYTLQMTEVPPDILHENGKNKRTSVQFFEHVIWRLIKFNISLLTTGAFVRICSLLQSKNIKLELEQLGFYMLLFAITAIAREAYYGYEKYPEEICFVITQRFKLVPVVPVGRPIRIAVNL